jgi:type II secretory pathway predicted ATPase ExeA
MDAADQLQLGANPFAGGFGARACGPLQTALSEVIRHIASEIPVVVVAGASGTGKTLLAGLAARACAKMSLSVSQIDRGDLVCAPDRRSGVLLIDEADSLTAAALQALLPLDGSAAADTIVFLCLPANARRFAQLSPRAAIVKLSPLMPSEAQAFLLERAASAGQPELFSPGAVLLLIEGAHGLPRVLGSVAGLAYFSAAMEHSCEIGARHVAEALEGQMPSQPPEARPINPPTPAPASLPDPLAELRANLVGGHRDGFMRSLFYSLFGATGR